MNRGGTKVALIAERKLWRKHGVCGPLAVRNRRLRATLHLGALGRQVACH